MKTKILFASMIIVLSACSLQNEKKNEENPNILFLLADDQRAGTINALGNPEIITPNMDMIANEGFSFSNTYLMGAMNGAVCAPSRAMLMTGRSLYNIDPTGNTIDTAHITLPKTLEQNGYHTFHIGKWHNGRPAFIQSFGDGSKFFFGGMHSQYNVPTYEFSQAGDYSTEKQNELSPKHSSELYADAAVEFLKNYNSDKPFFLYVAFQAPHDPREMPQKYLDMYDTASLSLPSNFKSEHPFDNGEIDIRDEWLAGYPRTSPEVKANIAAYYAMITHLDEQIGRILKVLKERGMEENTIVVFSGDNGLAVGQHGLMGKQNLYEHSINVPLIIKGPGIPQNKRTENSAYLFDIYPTICDLAGVKDIPESVQGISLKPTLMEQEQHSREVMFFAYKNFQRAVRKGKWKLIKYNVNNEVTTQLFDLEVDPYETTNLADNPQYKNQLDEMTEVLSWQMLENNDLARLDKEGWGVPVLPAWKDKTDPEEVEHLRGLAEKEREMRGF